MEQLPVVITDFTNLANQKWRIVNDDVMGGLSESHFQINSDGHAVFLGEISLKNNGGFASVRNQEPLNLFGFEAVRLKVKGDGSRYSFRLKPNPDSSNPAYWYEHRFETEKDEWSEIVLPFSSFKPTYRGSTPKDAPQLDLKNISHFGFLISDKQSGKFRLEVNKIEAIP
ncbi:CIA30 family protein [Rhodohalobacter sp.]|uniref:CIA30 family protein n=1 Tax=Rhodohalobacter sp. TaxID=1974210 RepID=UPI002ACD5E2F|nr:CIA30 family protein [Rhodohalobacter sp.]MDZ7758011.1 CIA30 family protein [Rhodohalobacter sp.]